MEVTLYGIAVTVGLVLAMLAGLEGGRRLAVRRRRREGDSVGIGELDGAIFALLGLLIAFTFGGASSRFDALRHLAIEEANAIGTAWLRLDLLPAVDQPALREDFRRYVEARIAVHRALPDVGAFDRARQAAAALQADIWTRAVAAVGRDERPQTATLMIAALNEAFDVANARDTAARMHVPSIVVALLVVLALLSSLLAGSGMAARGARSGLHMLAFAVVMASTIYVILDFEFPSIGLIRLGTDEHVMTELQQSLR